MRKCNYIKTAQCEGTLFISDEADYLRKLKQAGEKCVLLLTEQNREEDLSEFPYAIENWEDVEDEYLEKVFLRLSHKPWRILETDRCIVREITVLDVDRLYEIYSEPTITEYMEGLCDEKKEEEAYIENYIRYVYTFYGYGMWVVEDKDTGIVIGRAGIEEKGGRTELGYVIALPWQKKGIAWEVCRAILVYAEEKLGIKKIYSCVQKGNTASVRLLEKLGFVEEEEADWTKSYVWSMIRQGERN